MDILNTVRLVLLLVAAAVFVGLVRQLPTGKVRGVYLVATGFGVILFHMGCKLLLQSPWIMEKPVLAQVIAVTTWTGWAGETVALVLVMFGSYLAIRSLIPQLSEHYSSLVERSLVGVYLVQDGLIKFVNPRLAEIFGCEVSEMVGKPFLDFVAPESMATVTENVKKRLDGNLDAVHYELKGLTRRGGLVDIEVYGNRTSYLGQPALHGTLLDITWRKKTEQELLKSHGRYRSLMEQSGEGVWRIEFDEPLVTSRSDRDQVDDILRASRIVECNNKLARMNGFKGSLDLIGKGMTDLFPKDDRLVELLSLFVHSGYQLTDAEMTIDARQGDVHHFLLNLIGFIENGCLSHIWGIQRDITLLTEARNALSRIAEDVAPSEGDEFFRIVAQRLSDALRVKVIVVGLLSEDGRHGVTKAVQVDHSVAPNFTVNVETGVFSNVMQKSTWCCPQGVSAKYKDDPFMTRFNIDSFVCTPLLGHRAEVVGFIAAMDARSMPDLDFKKALMEVFALRTAGELRRIDTEGALRQSEQRYRGLFENSLTANYISTPDGRLLACNESFARLYGFDSVAEAMAVRAENVYTDRRQREAFVNMIREKGKLAQSESTYVRKDGRPLHVVENAIGVFDDAGNLVQIEGTLLDVTERKRMEEQLLQSQKIDSLGVLAGGIAHDFNNLLTIVNTNLFLAEASVDPGHPVLGPINEIKTTVKRAVSLTGQILAFGRKQVLERKHHELDVIVQEFAVTLRRIIEEDIQISLSANSSGTVIHCDRGQIEQILLNLCVNARDAMKRGGTIGIRTYATTFTPEFCAENGWAKEGRFVCLEVTDDGCGIDAGVLEKIFDPFFTTKEVGKGSGMGLAVVYGIIKAHQGLLDVRSAPGRGSVFSAYLPAVERIAEETDERSLGKSVTRRGTETILVVEDNNQIRDVTSMILAEHGYTVLTANNGEEAVQIMAHPDNHIDLVFTDMVMPKMGGRELFEVTRKAKPEMKFIFTSGYTFVAQDMDFIGRSSLVFVQKPYQLDALLGTIRQVMDAR